MTEYTFVIKDGDGIMPQTTLIGYRKDMISKFRDILDVLSNNLDSSIVIHIGSNNTRVA